jgi:hypothetical protein
MRPTPLLSPASPFPPIARSSDKSLCSTPHARCPLCTTQMASQFGLGDDDLRPYVTPGLTGRLLKEHIKASVSKILPRLSEFKACQVDLSHLPVVPSLGTVTMYLRPVGAVITQMMTDTSRVGAASEHIDLHRALPDSLSGSVFVGGLQESIPEDGEQVPCSSQWGVHC